MSRSPNENFSPDEELFQRVPDGWLFTTPILWPVGGRKYLVSDVTKAELIERLARWRRRSDRMSSVLLLVLMSWQFTHYDWITPLSGFLGVQSELLGVTIFLAIVVLLAIATPILQLLAIRPVLTGTVLTPGKVGLWDSLLALPRSLAESSSLLVVLLCAAIVINGGFLWYRALTANGTQLSLIVLLAVGFVVTVPILVMVAALFIKLRAKRRGE